MARSIGDGHFALLIAVAGGLLACGDVAPVALMAGGAHSCAVMDEGHVRCWGAGAAGQLGHGDQRGFAEPVEVKELDDAVDLALGLTHSCALRADGGVMCWGEGSRGQLGDGRGASSTTPVQVVGIEDAIAVSSGEAHSCALRANGSVMCWGANDRGQLGDGTSTQQLSPVRVRGLADVSALASALGVDGTGHDCARRVDGSVWCWGDNDVGQLGDGGTTPSNAPVEATVVSGATSVAAAITFSCALVGDGQLSCWGLVDDEVMTALATERFVALAGGSTHMCALDAAGAVTCFGGNFSGELGTADGVARFARVDMPPATRVSAGSLHSCALLTDGSARCWGENNNGRLGDGSVGGTRPSPVTVVGLD